MSDGMPDKDFPVRAAEALERIGGDKAFLFELIEIYCVEFGPKTKNLEKAIKANDFVAIRDIAHNLKGSSGSLGLGFLQIAALNLEKAARKEEAQMAWRALVELKREYRRLETYLSREEWKSSL